MIATLPANRAMAPRSPVDNDARSVPDLGSLRRLGRPSPTDHGPTSSGVIRKSGDHVRDTIGLCHRAVEGGGRPTRPVASHRAVQCRRWLMWRFGRAVRVGREGSRVVNSVLRLNMTLPGLDPERLSEMYAA